MADGIYKSGMLNNLQIPEDFVSLVTAIENSTLAGSLPDFFSADLLMGLGIEALVTMTTSALGFGLLVNGYQMYQSLEGLEAALEYAAIYDKSALILHSHAAVKRLLGSLNALIPDWFAEPELQFGLIAQALDQNLDEGQTSAIKKAIGQVVDAFSDSAALPASGSLSDLLQKLEQAGVDRGLNLQDLLTLALTSRPELLLNNFVGLVLGIRPEDAFGLFQQVPITIKGLDFFKDSLASLVALATASDPESRVMRLEAVEWMGPVASYLEDAFTLLTGSMSTLDFLVSSFKCNG